MIKAAKAHIDTSALIHNLDVLRAHAPNSKVLTVVKSDGYGHGLLQVAKAFSASTDGFGVARLEEALCLRGAGIARPILLLEGFYEATDLPVLVANNLYTAVHCAEQLEALERAKLEKPITVWLKIDTGMHRVGIQPEEVTDFVTRLEACPNVAKPVNFMSHFGCADEPDRPVTQEQIKTFTKATHNYEGTRSIAASSGSLIWPSSHFEWIRPGISLYGISPMSEKCGNDFALKTAMTLTSTLIAVRDVKAGHAVGYGGRWVSERDTKMGVVAIGYGDGYPRSAPDGTPVLVNGREVPIAGRVSMDMITVDLGPDSKDKVGDEVTLWGPKLPPERIAEWVGTIAYELVCQITPRVVRFYS